MVGGEKEETSNSEFKVGKASGVEQKEADRNLQRHSDGHRLDNPRDEAFRFPQALSSPLDSQSRVDANVGRSVGLFETHCEGIRRYHFKR